MSKISCRDVWIILAGYLAAIHVGKLSAVIPVLQQDLNLSFTQAGFSLALVQAAGMLFALCIGAFSEKMGLKRCLIMALSILGLSSLAGLWITQPATLYVLRFMEGIGFLTISLCAPAILKRTSRAETLNFKMGLWSSYMGIGVSLAVLTIPLLLEYLDWQTIWAILGCLCLVIAVMIKQYLNIEPVLITQPDFSQKLAQCCFGKSASCGQFHEVAHGESFESDGRLECITHAAACALGNVKRSNVFSVQEYLPGCGCLQPGDQLRQRCFPAAVGACEHDKFSVRNSEIHTFDNLSAFRWLPCEF